MSARRYYPANHVDSNETLKQATSGFHIRALIEVIQQAPDLKSLQELLSDHRQLYVSIQNLVTQPGQLVSAAKGSPRVNTIEFRQHAGITGSRDALPWISFLGTLVKYSHSQNVDSVRAICTLAASDPRLSLPDFFGILGIEKQTRLHYLDRSRETLQKALDDTRAAVEKELFDGGSKIISLQLSDERAEAQDPEAVAKTIQKKFKEGGYGQFSRKFIDIIASDLSAEEKQRLTIGWKAPARRFY